MDFMSLSLVYCMLKAQMEHLTVRMEKDGHRCLCQRQLHRWSPWVHLVDVLAAGGPWTFGGRDPLVWTKAPPHPAHPPLGVSCEPSSHPLWPLPPSAPSSGLAAMPSCWTGGLAGVWQRGLASSWISQAVTSGRQLVLPAGPCVGCLSDFAG